MTDTEAMDKIHVALDFLQKELNGLRPYTPENTAEVAAIAFEKASEFVAVIHQTMKLTGREG